MTWRSITEKLLLRLPAATPTRARSHGKIGNRRAVIPMADAAAAKGLFEQLRDLEVRFGPRFAHEVSLTLVPTNAFVDAILDRLVLNARRIELDGPSM